MIRNINANRELSKIETYKMTKDSNIEVVKNIPDGTPISVDAYLTFEDVKEQTGEVVELLSILTVDGTVYSCQSKTFKNSFMDIADIFDGDKFTVVKKSGVTKAGRPYIDCALA